MIQRLEGDSYDLLRGMQSWRRPAARIAAIGVHLPERVVDNEELVRMIEAPPRLAARLATLVERATGCQTRRYAPPGTAPSDLAVAAARQALERGGLAPSGLDALIFASTDMDTLEPATANIVQEKLGLPQVNSFDVSNACNSFLQAINLANSLLACGAAGRVLICSGEVGSYVCNRKVESVEDLDIKIGGLTLGDAGAAMVLERSDGRSGFTEINLTNLAAYWKLCHVPETTDWRSRPGGLIHGWFYLKASQLAGLARDLTRRYFAEYRVYRKAAFGETDLFSRLDHIVPHQISRRLIEALARDVAPQSLKKLAVIAHRYGNTASTTIPLALESLISEGSTSLGSGHDVLLYGMSSGFGIGHLRLIV